MNESDFLTVGKAFAEHASIDRVGFFECRATLIMSPFGDVTTIEMSPYLEVSTGGGQIGKDSDEQ